MLHLLNSVIFHGEAKQLVISAATGEIQSTRTGDKTNKDVYATPSKVLRENSDDQPKNQKISGGLEPRNFICVPFILLGSCHNPWRFVHHFSEGWLNQQLTMLYLIPSHRKGHGFGSGRLRVRLRFITGILIPLKTQIEYQLRVIDCKVIAAMWQDRRDSRP